MKIVANTHLPHLFDLVSSVASTGLAYLTSLVVSNSLRLFFCSFLLSDEKGLTDAGALPRTGQEAYCLLWMEFECPVGSACLCLVQDHIEEDRSRNASWVGEAAVSKAGRVGVGQMPEGASTL